MKFTSIKVYHIYMHECSAFVFWRFQSFSYFEEKTKEAVIISSGIDKMPPDRREQALKVLQTIFSDYFDGGKINET